MSPLTLLPDILLRHLRTRRTRKLRKLALDLRRMKSAYRGRSTPNPRELRVKRVPLRDRIMEWWQVWHAEWRADLRPRTPEQVAREAYERELVLRGVVT